MTVKYGLNKRIKTSHDTNLAYETLLHALVKPNSVALSRVRSPPHEQVYEMLLTTYAQQAKYGVFSVNIIMLYQINKVTDGY